MLRSIKKKTSGLKKNTNTNPSSANSRQTSKRTSAKMKIRPLFSQNEALALYNEALSSFRDISSSTDKQDLFIKKLQLCSYMFDFGDASAHVQEQEMKRATLLELVDYVSASSGRFTEAVAEDIMHMVSCNLFRGIGSTSKGSGEHDSFEGDEEEPSLEPSWPHLQIVYEFLLRYVVANDTEPKFAKKYINQHFIVQLLDLFLSEDPRERDYLKTILHRIYGKFMVHRPFIRKTINNIFYGFIFETEKHAGIAELLEILGSIINGFALPLKEEHKNFLFKALMPLHKPNSVAQYHQQLSYCVVQFVEKDPKLSEQVLLSLLHFWPVTNSQKEVLFLTEVEEILELTLDDVFPEIMIPVFKQIARCSNSSHFQVAEKSLWLWNNECVVTLVSQHRQIIVPLVFGALELNARSHWNSEVHALTCNVRKLFMEMDNELYDVCKKKYDEDVAQDEMKKKKRESVWKALKEKAESKPNAHGYIPASS